MHLSEPIRLLIVEDNESDAELMSLQVEQQGHIVQAVRVDTSDELRRELERQRWDLVLSDFRMPGLNAFDALDIVKQKDPDLPFIIVSGAIGEELAVTGMKKGAHDFISKDHLDRLGPVVVREIQDRELRLTQQEMQEEINQTASRLAAVMENLPVGVIIADEEGKLTQFNPQSIEIMGGKKETKVGKYSLYEGWWYKTGKKVEEYQGPISRAFLNGETLTNELIRFKRFDGKMIIISMSAAPIYNQQNKISGAVAVLQDVTEIVLRQKSHEILARAGDIIASSTQVHQALESLSSLLIPELGDWCCFTLTPEDGCQVIDNVLKFSNSVVERDVRKLLQKYPPEKDPLVHKVCETAKSYLLEDFAQSEAVKLINDPEYIKDIEQIGFKSALLVPLVSSGVVSGTLYLATRETSFDYSKHHLELLEELGRRISSMVATSRAYERSQEYINILQRERELRERFVATITHDLRSPLAAAKTSLDYIQRYPDRAEIRERSFGRIQNSLRRMNGMIENLLDANRVEAGQPLPINRHEMDLVSLVTDVVVELSVTHVDRFKVSAPSSLLGCWDPDALRRVLDNICNNALKYGEDSSPIEIILIDNKNSACVKVHNKGKPLSKVEVERIFGSYQRSVSAEKSGTKGWGLGLLISRAIVEAHDGHIHAESSAESGGTTFIFEMPKNLVKK